MNQSYMNSEQLSDYAEALDLELSSLEPIQRNKYCAIGRGTLRDGTRVIIKDYGKSDPQLAKLEAEALQRYHAISSEIAGIKQCDLLAFNVQRNLLAISFMDGISFTRFVYASLFSASKKRCVLQHAKVLGSLLRELYTQSPSAPGHKLDAFMLEYLNHSTSRLSKIPLISSFIFRKGSHSPQELLADAETCGERLSFCHGDCVPRNAHTDDTGIGLIDWANTSSGSHILNDVYNLRMAIQNMFLPRSYRLAIMSSVSAGLGDLSFDIRLHRFFYEYHRRRWLMLKFYARRPWPLIQAFRGLFTFAFPFDPSRLPDLQAQQKDCK